MAATTNVSDNRPPPDRRQSISLFTPGVPWYRDVKVLRILAQLVFVVLFIGAGYVLFSNLVSNLTASNLSLDFAVYRRPFNVAVNEGLSMTEAWTWAENTDLLGWLVWLALLAVAVFSAFTAVHQFRRRHLTFPPVIMTLILAFVVVTSPPAAISTWLSTILKDYFYPSSMSRAFVTGIYNTLQVVLFSLIGCTLLGIFVGIGLLSKNFLVRNVARIYVEIFRNTPLVVQLIFLYRTLTLILPAPRQSVFGPSIGENMNLWIFNARGMYFPRFVITETTHIFYAALLVGLLITWIVRRWRTAYRDQTGKPAYLFRYTAGIMLSALALGILFSGTPYTISYPFLKGPNVQEGLQLSLSFVALFLGLTLYTAAFVAEIVRAGIQSVPYGQIEAARSQGFTGSQVLSMIVLPQALRLIIPPLGNQYVNLGKNSSLALVVGYVDTYRIAQIANNESGQAVPFFALLMLIYLTISLTLSFLTNLFNRSTRLKTR
jgi:general L-amino acid transport system permease protein